MSSDKRLIPMVEPDLRGREAEYLNECIRTGWISSAGRYVSEMEEMLAGLTQSAHALATSSGTTAIQLILATIGVGTGARVIVPDWTFAATANAVVHAGATPILVDVDPVTWGLDAGLVDEELTAARERGQPVGAVIAVDPLGLPADFDSLIAVCHAHGVPLIEDAAGAIGSTYKHRPAGGLGDAGILSFNGNKLVTGGGGAILTSRDDWANRARHLSGQARTGEAYTYDAVGFNYRITNLNAAVVVAQLERLAEMKASRRDAAAAYTEAISGRNDLTAPPAPIWADWNGWMYAVRTASAAEAERLVVYLQSQGVGARAFWTRLSSQPPYAGYRHRLKGASEALSGCLVSLPCGSTLTHDQICRVAMALKGWRGQ